MYFENFLSLCKDAGVAPSRAGLEAGIASTVISQWKKGKYTPKLDKLQKLADYFEVPITTIIGPDGKEDTDVKPYLTHVDQLGTLDGPIRLLVDAARDASAEDIEVAISVLQSLKNKSK